MSWQKLLANSWRRWDRATAMYAKPFDPVACELARQDHFALLDLHERYLRGE